MYPMFGNPHDLIIFLVILVLSSAYHEFAHAWVALKCGDDTSQQLGRVTLNPVVHIGLFESILLPAVVYFGSGGAVILGGAKPVPVVPDNLRRPNFDMCLVAIAGPISNLLILLIAMAVLIAMEKGGVENPKTIFLMWNIIWINFLLMMFNMLPIPPLDGSRVLRFLIPPLRKIFNMLDYVGILILVGLMFFVPAFQQFVIAMLGAGWEYVKIAYSSF